METPRKSLTFDEKKQLYIEHFSLGTVGSTNSVNDKLILLSLLSLTYMKMREKNSKITVIEILQSITKHTPDDSYFYQMLESLSLLVEDLCYNCNIADSCGLSSSKEIVSKIKEILNTWIPF